MKQKMSKDSLAKMLAMGDTKVSKATLDSDGRYTVEFDFVGNDNTTKDNKKEPDTTTLNSFLVWVAIGAVLLLMLMGG